MATPPYSYKVDVNVGIFMFDSRDENDLSLSVNDIHTFVVSEDEGEIQNTVDEIFEKFPPSESYGFKKGQYRYKNSDYKLNPIAVKVLLKNGIKING